MHMHTHAHVGINHKMLFKVIALIFFLISTYEESSLPMKHTKIYRINIFDYEGHNSLL